MSCLLCVRAPSAPSSLTALEKQKFSSEEQVKVEKHTRASSVSGSARAPLCRVKERRQHAAVWSGGALERQDTEQSANGRPAGGGAAGRSSAPGVNCWKTLVALRTFSVSIPKFDLRLNERLRREERHRHHLPLQSDRHQPARCARRNVAHSEDALQTSLSGANRGKTKGKFHQNGRVCQIRRDHTAEQQPRADWQRPGSSRMFLVKKQHR